MSIKKTINGAEIEDTPSSLPYEPPPHHFTSLGSGIPSHYIQQRAEKMSTLLDDLLDASQDMYPIVDNCPQCAQLEAFEKWEAALVRVAEFVKEDQP